MKISLPWVTENSSTSIIISELKLFTYFLTSVSFPIPCSSPVLDFMVLPTVRFQLYSSSSATQMWNAASSPGGINQKVFYKYIK